MSEKEPSSNARSSLSPLGLLGILFSSIAIIGWIRLKVKSPLGQSTNSVGSDNGADDGAYDSVNDSLRRTGITETNRPPSPSQCRYTEKKPKRWYKRWRPYVFILNIFTFVAVVWYACITHSMWKEMKEQTRTAQQQLEATERPWIKIIDVQTRGNGPVVPALSFDMSGNDFEHKLQATLQLNISVRNIGHSVAEVAVRPELFLPRWSEFGKAVPDEQKRFCASAYGSARSGYYPSVIIFPQEPFDWYGTSASFVDATNTNQLPPQFGSAAYVVPVVIVCVNYRLKGLPNAYQSGAVYEVFRTDNRTRFFPPGVGMKASQMFFERNPVQDYAD